MPFHFQIDFQPVGKGRKIRGMVSSPNQDLEKEIITAKAFREALSNFMKHPILHVRHTERPVGLATSAVVKANGESHIEAEIFTSEDTDDVWDEIEKGSLCKYSIFGRRKVVEGPCHLSPGMRSSPCITKALDLWSISLVGNNAINQDTYLEIAKSNLGADDVEYFTEKLALIFKSGPTNSEIQGDIMVQDPKPEDQAPTTAEEIVKASPETDTRLSAIETNIGEIVKAIGGLAEIMKAATPPPAPTSDPIIEKAKLDLAPIVKAAVDAAVGDIRKSMDTLVSDFAIVKSELETVKGTVVRKSGTAVYIPLEGEDYNPRLANLSAIGE